MDKCRMEAKARKYGIELTRGQLALLEQYSREMLAWNEKSNITAITKEEDIEDKHFLDSLILASQPEIQGRVADIGSGGGFPGMVLKIYKQDIEITLVESNNKKIAFLEHLAEVLELKGISFCKQRAEELGRGADRESFDLVTARAVAGLPMLAEYCLPLVKRGGWFIPMKGRLEEELQQAKNAIGSLGGRLKEERAYQLPGGDERKLYLIEKCKTTEDRYPRNTARIKKNPL